MRRRYSHLGIDERLNLAKWRDARMPIKEIALRLGRAPFTLYRELRRNHFRGKEIPELNGYHGMSAQDMYRCRRPFIASWSSIRW
jgi:transposase, IS30 family